MKVRIIASDFVLPIGTVLDVGDNPPKAWSGKYVVVSPLDHDGDGVKGGMWNADPVADDDLTEEDEPTETPRRKSR